MRIQIASIPSSRVFLPVKGEPHFSECDWICVGFWFNGHSHFYESFEVAPLSIISRRSALPNPSLFSMQLVHLLHICSAHNLGCIRLQNIQVSLPCHRPKYYCQSTHSLLTASFIQISLIIRLVVPHLIWTYPFQQHAAPKFHFATPTVLTIQLRSFQSSGTTTTCAEPGREDLVRHV